ncbi:MAG: iron export ABC transporter permease subunit FetB [Xenococcaceae cyanobacterium MO_188.B32]|nr:iron export ABC transporter permease subunit FetB [Xenococcaceae cyanobacterium MO_188.B32]
MNNLIELDFIDLALALGLIGLTIALSLWQKLSLEGQLIFGAGRSILQLLVVGYVLEIIFALNTFWSVLLILGVMTTIAAVVARNRISKKIRGLLPVVWLSLLASSALSVSYTILLIIQPSNWYEPQYLIPLGGMLLGNAMNGASLAGDRFTNAIKQNRLEVETHLCLGANPHQAITTYRQEAIRTGLIPTLNNMMVVGLVSLPGMFTGQVLAGSDPLNAASYQILILFAIVLTNLTSTVLVTEGLYRRFFNEDAQLILS